tara:strand:- start:1979 stop:3463 length:1485 start_codon:yes stop_codon:yes gene_type:complete
MIKKIYANADNTITNAHIPTANGFSETRATGSNMGASDIIEVYGLYHNFNTSSAEISRGLVQFPITEFASMRTANEIPASGSVNFYLSLKDAPSSETLPSDYTISVYAISSSWQEGYGLDMDNYSDLTYDVIGSNWIKRSGSTSWTTFGGDFLENTLIDQRFPDGDEDLYVDVSDVVESWLDGDYQNYGFLIRLSQSFEPYHSNSSGANVSPDFHNTTGSQRSFFTKRFFARNTEFYFKKPCIEARWDDSRKDDRGNFYTSSSLAPAADNLNTLYLYNYVRGQLKNIPAIGTGSIFVDLYSTLGASAKTQCIDTPATGGYFDTGIYTCSVCLETTESALFDVWHSGGVEYHTGSLSTLSLSAQTTNQNVKYIISLTNHKKEYHKDEIANINVFIRPKDWSPNIYTVAQSTVTNTIIEEMHYKIERSVDDFIVVDYATGSIKNTLLSYNDNGNYFNFDMAILEPGYEYKFKFATYEDYRQTYVEQPYEFKFKVSE